MGWTPDSVFAPGGTDEESFVVWGAAYSIVGNGTTPTRGLMTQGAVNDSLGAPLIQANTDYTVRPLRAQRHAHFYTALHEIAKRQGINLPEAPMVRFVDLNGHHRRR